VEELTSLTVEYASPEQARLAQEDTPADAAAPDPGADTVGPQSDLYSLATILYETITGHLPFPLQAHDDQAYLHKVIYDPPELPISGVPPDLNTILARALDKNPEARYPSARAFADDLSRLSIKPVSFPERERRSRSGLVGLAGLMVGLAIGFAIGQATAVRTDPTWPVSNIPPSLTPTSVTDTPAPDTPTPEATLTEATNTPMPPTSTLRPTETSTTAPKITPSVAATAAQ
jgi:eukaryotic-like serine/threonine-protein kinase